jgi:hypothetical protein
MTPEKLHTHSTTKPGFLQALWSQSWIQPQKPAAFTTTVDRCPEWTTVLSTGFPAIVAPLASYVVPHKVSRRAVVSELDPFSHRACCKTILEVLVVAYVWNHNTFEDEPSTRVSHDQIPCYVSWCFDESIVRGRCCWCNRWEVTMKLLATVCHFLCVTAVASTRYRI